MPLPRIDLPGERSRAEELYAVLRTAILDGTLHANERLVEEAIGLAASVSRTPVREALHKLEVDGFVQAGSRGMVVAAFTLDELADLCSVRETLEAMATGLAAVSLTELELITLKGIHARFRDAIEREAVEELVSLNHVFHEAIWHGSRNRYLADRLRVLRSQIERLQETTLAAASRRREALAEHEEMLRAIASRDLPAAEAIARQHFRRAMAIRLTNRHLASSQAVG
jgi:DNA-binding GntR family transcriptional regulator